MTTRTPKHLYPTHLRTTATGFLCGRTDAGNVGTFSSREIVDCPDCMARMQEPTRTLAFLALDLIDQIQRRDGEGNTVPEHLYSTLRRHALIAVEAR